MAHCSNPSLSHTHSCTHTSRTCTTAWPLAAAVPIPSSQERLMQFVHLTFIQSHQHPCPLLEVALHGVPEACFSCFRPVTITIYIIIPRRAPIGPLVLNQPSYAGGGCMTLAVAVRDTFKANRRIIHDLHRDGSPLTQYHAIAHGDT